LVDYSKHSLEYEAELDDSDSDDGVSSSIKKMMKPKPLIPAKLPKKSFTSYMHEVLNHLIREILT